MGPLRDHSDVIDRLGRRSSDAETAFAKVGITVAATTIRTWRRRGIPADRFPDVVALAQRIGAPEITLDLLHKLPRLATACRREPAA